MTSSFRLKKSKSRRIGCCGYVGNAPSEVHSAHIFNGVDAMRCTFRTWELHRHGLISVAWEDEARW